MSPARLHAARSSLLVIDVQDKLLPFIPRTPTLLMNLTFLLDAAGLLEVPVMATEQYPKGLGPTASVVAKRLPANLPSKVAFSCAVVPEVNAGLCHNGRTTVLLAGIETHVCVLQTALDLIERNMTVFVAADAVAGRYTADHDLALRRMERAGAVLTTVESAVFEWTATAGAPQFKGVSALVQERMRLIRELSELGHLHEP